MHVDCTLLKTWLCRLIADPRFSSLKPCKISSKNIGSCFCINSRWYNFNFLGCSVVNIGLFICLTNQTKWFAVYRLIARERFITVETSWYDNPPTFSLPLQLYYKESRSSEDKRIGSRTCHQSLSASGGHLRDIFNSYTSLGGTTSYLSDFKRNWYSILTLNVLKSVFLYWILPQRRKRGLAVVFTKINDWHYCDC